MILFLASLLFIGPALLLCFLALGYRYRARIAEARANRAEGALNESRGYAETMRDMAVQAIQVAAEKHFPRESRGFSGTPLRDWTKAINEAGRDLDEAKARLDPNYVHPIVAYCSNCNVSVRHEPDKYPVPCPACSTLIDPVLDNPPEL